MYPEIFFLSRVSFVSRESPLAREFSSFRSFCVTTRLRRVSFLSLSPLLRDHGRACPFQRTPLSQIFYVSPWHLRETQRVEAYIVRTSGTVRIGAHNIRVGALFGAQESPKSVTGPSRIAFFSAIGRDSYD